MACTWFGEIPPCSSLTLLLGSAWVLLKCVLQTIFSGPVVTLSQLIRTFCNRPQNYWKLSHLRARPEQLDPPPEEVGPAHLLLGGVLAAQVAVRDGHEQAHALAQHGDRQVVRQNLEKSR